MAYWKGDSFSSDYFLFSRHPNKLDSDAWTIQANNGKCIKGSLIQHKLDIPEKFQKLVEKKMFVGFWVKKNGNFKKIFVPFFTCFYNYKNNSKYAIDLNFYSTIENHFNYDIFFPNIYEIIFVVKKIFDKKPGDITNNIIQIITKNHYLCYNTFIELKNKKIISLSIS